MMTDKPWNAPTHKPYYKGGRPQNVRMRCQDCGGQFYETTQLTKMDAHCFVMSGKLPAAKGSHGQELYHHSWHKAVGYANDKFWVRTISDSTDEYSRRAKEDGYDLEDISVKNWLALNR